MDYRAEATIEGTREDVYRVYRDKMVDLVPYLPNIRGIEVKSRADAGPKTELVNVWHGGGEIPATIRSLLKEGALSWTDYASWDEPTWTCDWRSETHSFREAVTSRGHDDFVALGPNRTAIRMTGHIVVDGTKVPHVPRLLAGTVGKAIEAFLVKQIQDNLAAVGRGVERYLKEHPLSKP
jgi:hypothetical protein